MQYKKQEKAYNSYEINTNEVTIVGDVVTEPELNHTTYDEDIYLFYVDVKRISGVSDRIPVMLSNRVINIGEIIVGSKVYIKGQLRSIDKRFSDSNMPKAFIFSTLLELVTDSSEYVNDITLSGYVCKKPTLRVTPINNRDVSDMVLAVNRKYGKSDYLSCITWGRNAKFSNSTLDKGSYVEVNGRLQSRDFIKHFEDGTEEIRHVYEVSVNKLTYGHSKREE